MNSSGSRPSPTHNEGRTWQQYPPFLHSVKRYRLRWLTRICDTESQEAARL
jgi:hypothetical protein